MTKRKNELLIQQRRDKLLEKYTQSEEKIKKQKEDNDKVLMKKNLLAAIKRDDTAENLSRYERQQELERKRKVEKIEQRSKRLDDMQKEKEKINLQKRIMGNNLIERKKLLLDKVSSILTAGNFKSKEDIYRKVFNEDELQTLGYSMNKTISSNNSRMKRNSKINKTEANDEEKNNKVEDGFFLTQGNNPNEANTIGVSKTHKNEENEKNMNENMENNNNEEEIKEDNHDDENKEYNDEFES